MPFPTQERKKRKYFVFKMSLTQNGDEFILKLFYIKIYCEHDFD